MDSLADLKQQGLTNTQIGERVGMSRWAVGRHLKKTAMPTKIMQPCIPRTDTQWGHGGARMVKPSTREGTELVAFVSDVHFPYHDPDAVDAALRMLAAVDFHRVVLNGDINDFFQLSRFNRDGRREAMLQEEIDQGNEFRQAVRDACPDATVDEVEGNHDNRIKTYVAVNARPLASLRALEPESLFMYRDLDIAWHPGAGFRLRPEFLVKHGTLVRKGAGSTAKAEHLAAGISGISGHTHRLATYRVGGYVQRQWTEQGCLCRLDPDYIVGRPDWSQGCAIGEFSTSTGSFIIHEVPFVDGRLRFGKEVF